MSRKFQANCRRCWSTPVYRRDSSRCWERLRLLGRTFSPEEDLLNGPNAAVISERLWRRRFGADPPLSAKSALRQPQLSDHRRDAGFGSVPRCRASTSGSPAKFPPVVMRVRDARWESAVGRLQRRRRPCESAQADLAAVQARLASQFPATDANWTPLVEPLKEETVGGIRRSLWILFGAVSFVLLITCANVACLLLAQATAGTRNRRAVRRWVRAAGK